MHTQYVCGVSKRELQRLRAAIGSPNKTQQSVLHGDLNLFICYYYFYFFSPPSLKRAHHTADALKPIRREVCVLRLSPKCKTQRNKRRREQVTALLLPETYPLYRRRQVLHGRQSAPTADKRLWRACFFVQLLLLFRQWFFILISIVNWRHRPIQAKQKTTSFFFYYSCAYIYYFIPLGLNFLVFFLSA